MGDANALKLEDGEVRLGTIGVRGGVGAFLRADMSEIGIDPS